ncbi:Hypothetical protein A7982_00111 [Minicystis rosea]|nr:Hypothetical protein A7982_00111 [Minicystis rosea]
MAVAGCSGDAEPEASPTLRLRGRDAPVHGTITVTVDATPASAFHGVELAMRGERIGTSSSAPFVFILDSTAFADGPATLDATGVLARTGELLHATTTIDIENVAPLLHVVTPKPDETILGTPTQGFHFAPIVEVADGSEATRIWADIGGAEIDLGAGDGSVSLALPPQGPDLPADFVPVTFHATDASGAESRQTIYVTGSNAALQAGIPDKLPIVDVRALPGGGALVGVGSKVTYGVVLDRSLDAPVHAVMDGNIGPVARVGKDALYFWPEMSGLHFVHATDGAAPTTLFELDAAAQTRALGPVALSGDRIAVAVLDRATSSVRFDLLAAAGSMLFETSFAVPAGTTLGDGVVEAPDQTLLVPMGPSYLHIDPSSGTTGPVWPSPEATIVLADHEGLVVRRRPDDTLPEIRLTGFIDTTSPPAWEAVMTDDEVVLHAARAAGGSARVLVDTATTTELRRYGQAGMETLWTAPTGTHASLLSVVPGSGDLILRVGDGSPGGFDAVRLQTDGTAAWTLPIDLDPGPIAPLDDGAVALIGLRASDGSAHAVVLGPEGIRWNEPSALIAPSRAIVQDGVFIAVGSQALTSLVVEARSVTTGTLQSRYRGERASAAKSGPLPLSWSSAWGVALTAGALALGATEHPKYENALLGFLP